MRREHIQAQADEHCATIRQERLDRAREHADSGTARLPRMDPCEARELLQRLREARKVH